MAVGVNAAPSTKAWSLKRTGLAGILLGMLALVACEIPIVIAFISIGGLATASAIAPALPLETGGIVAALAGVGVLVSLKLLRSGAKRKEHPP